MSKGAFVEPGMPMMPEPDEKKGSAARITSLQEFMDFARVHELTKMTKEEGEEIRDQMTESVLGIMAREEEIMMDEIIGLVDKCDMEAGPKEDLFVALADVLTEKSVENLNVSKVVEIIQSSQLDDAKKNELISKFRSLIDSFSLVRK